MNIVIDPNVLRNAHVNKYGQTLSHVVNKAQYYRHVYTEELRAEYGRATLPGPGIAQNIAAKLAQVLYLYSTRARSGDLDMHNKIIKREIIVPFLSAAEACGDSSDCHLTESDKQLVRVAKHIVENAPALEAPKIILLLDCPAGSGERCLCQAGWTARLISEVPGTHICHAADCDSLNRWLQKDTKFSDQQHQARFEQVCGAWLDRKHACYGQVNYKYSTMVNGESKGFEQDYFCDIRVNNLRHMYIGESKLLEGAYQARELNEGVGQLERAVRDLAQDEPAPNNVDCFLLSNSSCLADELVKRKAQQFARAYGVSVHLYRVTMPNHWKNQPNWLPEDGDFEEVCLFPAEVAR